MLVVGDAVSAHPEVVAEDFGVDIECVVCSSVPVGPVQGVVGCSESLEQVLVGSVILLKRLAIWILYV